MLIVTAKEDPPSIICALQHGVLLALRRAVGRPGRGVALEHDVFLGADVLPDGALIAITTADAYHLGVLSSRVHVTWALAMGGRLEDRPRYNSTRCFEPFPFPTATEEQAEVIRSLAEEIDGIPGNRDRKPGPPRRGSTTTAESEPSSPATGNQPSRTAKI